MMRKVTRVFKLCKKKKKKYTKESSEVGIRGQGTLLGPSNTQGEKAWKRLWKLFVRESNRARKIHVFFQPTSDVQISPQKAVCVRGQRSQLLKEEIQTRHSKTRPLWSNIMWKSHLCFTLPPHLNSAPKYLASHSTWNTFQNVLFTQEVKKLELIVELNVLHEYEKTPGLNNKETINRNIGCLSKWPGSWKNFYRYQQKHNPYMSTFEIVKLHPKQEPFVPSCGFSLHVKSLENVNINTPKHEDLSENALLKHDSDHRKIESPPTI